MATVSSLLVNLKANTAGFEKGIKRGRKSLAGFGSAAAKMGKFAVKSFAVLGIAAIAAGVALAVPIKGAMKAIDKIGKLSDSLNISTEALGGLGHASNITGTSFESVSKGLQKMQKNIGDAKTGIGEAKRYFDMFGLSADSLAKMDANESFKAIADEISRLPTAAEKTAASMAIFGRAGADMLNLLNQGSGGIEALQQEAEELGLTFSRLDAAKIEEANDSITRLMGLITGVTNSLAIALAPYIQLAADHFTEMGKDGGGATEWISEKMKGLVNIIGWVIKGVNLIKGVFNAVAGAIYKSIEWIIDGFTKLTETLAKAAEFLGADGLAESLRGVAGVSDQFAEGFHELATDKFDKAGENFAKAFGENVAEKIQNKLDENRKKVELKIGEAPITTAEDISAKTTKSKKADALSYNSSLIDVAALGGGLKDKDKALKKKNADANEITAKNTEKIAQALSVAALF